MTNEQFVKKFGKEYLITLKNAENKDFEINEIQFQKLINLCNFFKDYINENGGKAENICLNPAEIHSGITAEFTVFDVSGEDLVRFCSVLKDATAFSIDSTSKGKVCLSITIPDIFVAD